MNRMEKEAASICGGRITKRSLNVKRFEQISKSLGKLCTKTVVRVGNQAENLS